MDSDFEVSDDDTDVNDHAFAYRRPFLDECDDESKGVDSFNACFQARYQACPVFFSGTLADACRAAFSATEIDEHRPVLVYIHHDQSMFNHIFCKDILCSETMIEYLMENYLVWPWDVTLASNAKRLTAIWEQIFSFPLVNDFAADRCPMLLGITRRLPGRKRWMSAVEYQFTSLLKGDIMVRTQEKSTRDTLLSELIVFKEQSDAIELVLMCSYEGHEHDMALNVGPCVSAAFHFVISKTIFPYIICVVGHGSETNLATTESFYQCLQQRYGYCPTLITDALQSACEVGVNSITTNDCRPLLIYIHEGGDLSDNSICPVSIIDSLLENFLVFAWDNTSLPSKERMNTVWKEIFSYPLHSYLCNVQCPTLFGVMKLCERPITEYQCIPLLQGRELARTQTKLTREALLQELAVFQQQCIANEKALSSDFITKAGLCWDVAFQISEYLSLNDAVNTFSAHILPLLSKSHTRVHLSDPSETLLRIARHKLAADQVVSLQLGSAYLKSVASLRPLAAFRNVLALTFINAQHADKLGLRHVYFPKWRCVRFQYDKEVSVDTFHSIFAGLPESVNRLEIRYEGSFRILYYPFTSSDTIEYFLFDVRGFSLQSKDSGAQPDGSKLLMSTIKLMKGMSNIRYVCFLTNENNLTHLLNTEKWWTMACKCLQLTKVIFKVPGSAPLDESLAAQILQLEKKLSNVRKTIQLRLIRT